MLHSSEVVNLVSEMTEKYEIRNVVLDPVMVSTSGHRLIEEDAVEVIKIRLMRLARVITPNIPEAEILSGCSITTEDDFDEIAVKACPHNEYSWHRMYIILSICCSSCKRGRTDCCNISKEIHRTGNHLRRNYEIGMGHGPVNHFWSMKQ